ncbi:hypothetical protein Fcan01_10160 [Folsomia candida]|uniref:Uncharacterized protein n=1 Tax=Folsomia candida TaxID=158441 RepID=A0A226EEE5_FOLCA|nr:hypothetical protein Fcan01_10160 [Folsomia candida]
MDSLTKHEILYFPAVPAQRKIIRRPDLLNYTLRVFVWAGIILPPPGTLILSLLGTGPTVILANLLDTKFSWMYTWLPPSGIVVVKLAGFLVSCFVQTLLTMDLFRCFILLAMVVIMAVQFYSNLMDLTDAYFDRVQSLGKQGDMQHFKVHQEVVILCRLAAKINRSGSFIGITIVGTFSVGFVYVVVRMHSVIPTAYLLLCVLGVFITGGVQLVSCNYSGYFDDKGKMLLQKYKEGLATVGNVRKRTEMTGKFLFSRRC